jgi:ppGpp synthetase/RelA/SpoT-type nucleotidyltranferase
MALEMFAFIEDVIEYLEEQRDELEIATKNIEKSFKKILLDNEDRYFNINSRVKSASSLKEKIIRNNYYKKFLSPAELIYNLSDLIGIRIECRFIQDESIIYNILKEYFDKTDSEGYYYNSNNENLKLKLEGQQPQKQKNGFKIFRIDGVYEYNNKAVNFELQIKSMVNMFWGEIEHKIIYKNYSYILVDDFLKDIMSSLKKNLTMIDHQLLTIYNQFNKQDSIDAAQRKEQIETLLSKILYDIYSTRMKSTLGFVTDFKKSCDIIMKYILRTNLAKNVSNHNNPIINTLSRLNQLNIHKTNFDEEIVFERDIIFHDEFSEIVGSSLLELINMDFNWNLFFRILFDMEPGSNEENFETFLKFLKNRFYENKSLSKLVIIFNQEQWKKVIDSIMKIIAYSFNEINSINFLKKENIDLINDLIEESVDLIYDNISSYDEWEKAKDSYLKLLYTRILSIFDCKINSVQAADLRKSIKNSCCKLELKEDMLYYLDKME